MQLIPLSSQYRGETAQRWKYQHGTGEIGVISSVTRPFCFDCSRLRLSTDGKLYTCLFAHRGHDVRDLLRNHANDAQISTTLAHIWQTRGDRYSALRHQQTNSENKIEMSYIGG